MEPSAARLDAHVILELFDLQRSEFLWTNLQQSRVLWTELFEHRAQPVVLNLLATGWLEHAFLPFETELLRLLQRPGIVDSDTSLQRNQRTVTNRKLSMGSSRQAIGVSLVESSALPSERRSHRDLVAIWQCLTASCLEPRYACQHHT